MLRAAITNMVFILAAAILLLLAHYGFVPRIAFGLLLAVYLLVLFCGAYFIRLNFFVRSVLRGEPSAKQIALSFDDGPDGENTHELLDILDRHAVQATFFCIGKNIAGQESVLQRMVNAGHTIGNHSGTHGFFFDLLPAKKMLADMRTMDEELVRATGKKPSLFRPPYGVTNPAVARAIRLGGYRSVGWTVRSLDTVIKDPQKLFRKMMGRLGPGNIFLFHDSSDACRQMLDKFIAAVKADGYTIVRLDKMCNLESYA